MIDNLRARFFMSNHGMTYFLLGVNFVIFVISFLLSEVLELGDITTGVIMGGSSLQPVFSGQVWRLVTANFLQIAPFHFLLNALALFMYGRFIESFYSTRKIFIFYMLCGISGSVFALLSDFFNGGAVLTYGASGAIWGLIGVVVGNALRRNSYSPGLPVEAKEILPYVFFWLFLGGVIPGISFLGHLGGFVMGVLLGFVVETANYFADSFIESKVIPWLFKLCVLTWILSLLGWGFFIFQSLFFSLN